MKKSYYLLSLIFFSGAVLAQKDDKQITDLTLSKNKIESHIAFLASDELRGRNTPSPEQLIAGRYLATQLKSFGVKAFDAYPDYFQPVSMKSSSLPKEVTVSYDSKSFKHFDHTLLLDGVNTKFSGEAIFLNFASEEDLKNVDVKGKIIFARAGAEGEMNPRKWFALGRAKRKNALEHGALALIEFYNNAQMPWKILTSYFSGSVLELDEKSENSKQVLTHIWLNDAGWKEADTWKEKKKFKVDITVEGIDVKKFTTYNIVGYVEGSDAKLKNEYITYSAHYDHIGVGKPNAAGDSIYNGARDNAVGSVTVLSAAENIAKYPTKRSSLFVLFTGEEKGLLGSHWFVDHSPLDLKKIVYCFNSDNGGYNSTKIATIIGLGRTTAEDKIIKACEAFNIKAIDDPAPEQGLFDRSDNVSFAAKGIPAPTFSLGFTAFDEEIGKHYHQPSDQADNLDYDYLFKFFGSYVYSCRLIGNSLEKPFWKKGDKYYEAGEKLYK